MTILSDYKEGKGNFTALGKLRQLVGELHEVLLDDELTWDKKYYLVFDVHYKTIVPLLVEANLDLDYYNPDTTYEEDTRAYVTALEELIK